MKLNSLECRVNLIMSGCWSCELRASSYELQVGCAKHLHDTQKNSCKYDPLK